MNAAARRREIAIVGISDHLHGRLTTTGEAWLRNLTGTVEILAFEHTVAYEQSSHSEP